MVSNLFKRKEVEIKFLAVEKLALLYNLFTTLLIILFFNRLDNPQEMLMGRFLILVGTFTLIYTYTKLPSKFTILLRITLQMALLNYWYPDTFEFNRIFPNLDHIFASTEYGLFGCQPAMEFENMLSGTLWRELFNMGYWLYFPMVATLSFYYFFKRPAEVERCTFTIMAAFFLHYLIYIFLPVAGPQFYFPVIGEEAASSGIYESIGNHFNLHPDVSIAQEGKGVFFTELVNMAQRAGERPTAAFPSSHVGVAIVMMILAFRGSKKLFLGLLPFFMLLCCATVYIKAHYLIDALAGTVTGVLTYILTSWLYKRFLKQKTEM